HRERDLLRRLQDERVAASDGVGKEPERDHPREVEGRDDPDHADRLAEHQLVDAARDVLADLALQHHRDAARHLDVLDAATELADRLLARLAAFVGDGAREVLEVLLEKLLELEERLDAIAGRRPAPSGQRFRRRRGSAIDVRLGGERYLGDDLGGGRIRHRKLVARSGRGPASSYVVLDRIDAHDVLLGRKIEKLADRGEELLGFLQRRAVTAIGNLAQRRAPDTPGELAGKLGRRGRIERSHHHQRRVLYPWQKRPEIDRGERPAGGGEARGVGALQDVPALPARFRIPLQ